MLLQMLFGCLNLVECQILKYTCAIHQLMNSVSILAIHFVICLMYSCCIVRNSNGEWCVGEVMMDEQKFREKRN